MILRGAATGVVTSGAGGAFGLSVTDPARPDLAPSRPAYARVTGESYNTPHPPAFLSVTASGGRLQVTVHSEAPVDGYQIGISATSYEAPTVWWSTSSGSIDQEQTGGPWYLWARATYLGAYSLWSVYGQVRPEDDEWRLTWADEAMSGTVDTPYPWTSNEFGASALYDDFIPGIYVYGFYTPSLNVLAGAGGAHGTRVDFRLKWGSYTCQDIGVALCYDPAAMAADHATATYYALTLHDNGSGFWTLRLYSGVGTSCTQVAESGDIASHITRHEGGYGLYALALSVMARENVFSVTKSDGTVLFTATDSTYPWTTERAGAALWQYTTERYYGTNYIDYIRVYARDHTGEAETVTPGSASHNDLNGRDATGCHPAGAVSVTPSGGIAATDVAAALVELDTEKQPKDADLTAIAALTGTGFAQRTADDTWALASAVTPATTQTVNFDNSMTAAQIQALIDAVPRYVPTGATVTFQFADGTYTPTASLSFRGFFGGGTVNVQGDTGETNATSLHVTQDVALDFSASSVHGLTIRDNAVNLTVQNLHVKTKGTTSSSYRAFYLLQNPGRTVVRYCYAEAENATYGSGFYVSAQNAYIHTSYVSNCYYGLISAESAVLTSLGNDDYVDAGSGHASPAYGIYAATSIIFSSGTQPAGSTANTGTSGGGQIFS